MARIAGEILIGRPVDVVFDFVADQRNEPQYNPRMERAIWSGMKRYLESPPATP